MFKIDVSAVEYV